MNAFFVLRRAMPFIVLIIYHFYIRVGGMEKVLAILAIAQVKTFKL